ncbi:MAG: hypothetical protein QW597_06590 [Thermoplasmataceae archaeon]
MNYRMFIGIIEQEYTNKIASAIIRTSSSSFFGRKETDKLKETVQSFKAWVVKFITTTTITGPQNETMDTIGYVERVALEREQIPPYGPLHPPLVKTLGLFTESELQHFFSKGFVSNLEKLIQQERK